MTGKWRTGSGKKGQDGANEKDQGIGKDWDTNHILDRLPLEKRLNLMTFIIIIPLAVLVIYLMATVAMPIPRVSPTSPRPTVSRPTCGRMWTTACTALS